MVCSPSPPRVIFMVDYFIVHSDSYMVPSSSLSSITFPIHQVGCSSTKSNGIFHNMTDLSRGSVLGIMAGTTS